MTPSPRFSLNQDDMKRWANNTAIFFAPAILAFLLIIKMGGSYQEAFMALKMWGLNTSIDLLRKFIAKK